MCSALCGNDSQTGSLLRTVGPLPGRDHPLARRFEQRRGFREAEEVALVGHSAEPLWIDTTLHCPRPLKGMFTVYPIFLAHLSGRTSKGEVSKGHR